MKKVNAIIGRVKTGTYVYSVVMDEPDVPFGINGTGRSVEEAKQDFLAAYDDVRKFMNEKGEEYEELDFIYSYDIPSFLEYFAYALSLAGLERITGINQRQLSHYINGTSKPGRKTIDKFQRRILSFADDLRAVRFV